MKLELNNISHKYGEKFALLNVNYTLQNGVYGLLGPNGAGKTTLINIIVNLIKPTKGKVIFDGKSIDKWGADYYDHIGYLPQYPKFYANYTAREFLEYIAICKGKKIGSSKKQIDNLFNFVNLQGEENKKVGAYSGGMKQRLGIAQALLGDPYILILDEPTAGLDPKERIRFRNLISRISENHIVILATHIVSDLENAAKEIILLNNGRIIKADSPQLLIKELNGKVWEYRINEAELDSELVKSNVSNSRYDGQSFIVRAIGEKPRDNAKLVCPTLEEVYIYMLGEKDENTLF